jgi:hypothetical protein
MVELERAQLCLGWSRMSAQRRSGATARRDEGLYCARPRWYTGGMQNEARGLLTLTAEFAAVLFVIVVGLFALVAIIGGGNPLLVFGDECDRADCGAGPVIGLAAVVAFFCLCSGFVAAYFLTSRRD